MSAEKIGESILSQFDKLVKNYKILTSLFLGALFIEATLLIFFFPFLIKSAFFAITLSSLLITLFSFYTLRNYQATEKEMTLTELAQKYVKGVLSLTPLQKTPSEAKRISAEACLKLAETLKQRSSLPPKTPAFLFPLRNRFPSISGQEEARQFQEILFKKAIQEFSGQIRFAPCDIKAHACLAEAYILMSALFAPKEPRFLEMHKKAIEEYKILTELSPGEVWIWERLALSYNALDDITSEIETLERMLQLEPQSSDILFKLGLRYFTQGQTSKGFKTYEVLKTLDLIKSDQLIAHYTID